jgi:hypothetical protein
LQNKEKRNRTYQPKNNEGNGKVAVASGKGEVVVVAGSDNFDSECLAVLAACVSRDDEWILALLQKCLPVTGLKCPSVTGMAPVTGN